MHIGVVYYYVSDMDRALAFYKNKLGLKVQKLNPAVEAWAELETGGTILALEEKPKRGASHRPPLRGAVVSFCGK